MPTAAIRTFSGLKLEPAENPDLARMKNVKIDVSLNLARGTILGQKAGTNSRQQLVITGGPTGGTFTLTFGGQTTTAIAYNAPASDIQTALEALSSIGNGNVQVTGGPLPGAPVYIEFTGTLGRAVRATITSTDSLTGGSTPATAITSIQTGAAGTIGLYKAYSRSNVDGSQIPSAILAYDIQTDAAGLITLSSTASQAGGPQGETSRTIGVYTRGDFRCEDLVGLDQYAADRMGRIISGTVTTGLFHMA